MTSFLLTSSMHWMYIKVHKYLYNSIALFCDKKILWSLYSIMRIDLQGMKTFKRANKKVRLIIE